MAGVLEHGADWRSHLYSQVPLRTKNGDIRLLTVQPRTSQKTVQCYLTLARLTQAPKFITVSHNCESTGPETICINGASVPISRDLLLVLQHLQHESQPVKLWINVFCINPDDVQEKSTQMTQLREIYSAASKTIIWLGTAIDGSSEAIAALDRLAEEHLTSAAQRLLLNALRRTSLTAELPTSDGPASDAVENISPEYQQSLEDQLNTFRTPFQHLMKHDYWSRIWSLQELAFTAKGVVASGDRELDLDRFYQSARALDGVLNMATYSKWLASSKLSTSRVSLENIEPANYSQSPAIRLLAEREFFRSGRGWWSNTEHSLFSVLSRYYLSDSEGRMSLEVEDQRDLIYSLVGLATDAEDLGIAIDYAKDYRKTCMQTTAALLQKNPKVLRLCQWYDESSTNKPSWIVDWSKVKVPSSYSSGLSFHACGPADSRFYRVDTSNLDIIALKGVLLDTVQAVVKTNLENSGAPQESVVTVNDLLKHSRAIVGSPYSVDQKADIPGSMVTDMAFITTTGYVGLGKAIAEGDSIAIIYGSEVPFALRKQSDEAYRLIGEVYVLGIMEGEFMMGHRTESMINIT